MIGDSELRFIESFKDFVNNYDAADLFRLCRYPRDDFGSLCEITQRRANINLKPADVRCLSFTSCFLLPFDKRLLTRLKCSSRRT